MKIITCASYYGCGSSAVTDLFSEYDSVTSLGDFEFRFLHDIDGISDLEFHLTECPNRHNSGHALKRFMKLAEFNSGNRLNPRYEKFFNNQFLRLTQDYCNELTLYSYPGCWFYDYYDHHSIIGYYSIRFLERILSHMPFIKWRPMQESQTYGVLTDNSQFITITQNYLSRLLNAGNKNNSKYLMIDQLMPSSNVVRCLRYIKEDTFVFVVDRDPRDLYIMINHVWKNDKVAPKSPELFCKWIEFTRGCSNERDSQNNHVLKLNFEDLIYRYEETRNRIVKMVGLDESKHVQPFSSFNPRRSIVNTKTWEQYPEEADAIKYIEQHLHQYLYDFDAVKEAKVVGINCDNKVQF